MVIKEIYWLQIPCDDPDIPKIELLFGQPSTSQYRHYKIEGLVEYIENFNYDTYVDYIMLFCSMVKQHKQELIKIGVDLNDIRIWQLNHYDNQCNLFYSAEQMKAMSELGIALCVDCF
ncbi:MAG TPA: hypothetical protein VEC12_03960 [Bacteroidia bacterium]|nr:hypothetical protein [Bacteroidia bacterium]